MKKPDLTIVIATFNSAKLLPMVFGGLKRQKTGSFHYECMIVDGGSTDDTINMAKQFGCKIIKNPRTEPVYAKFLALNKSKTRYIMYLDHDEELMDERSLIKKMAAFKARGDVHSVLGSGYLTPFGYPFINEYINEFGDPFSCFVYRLSKGNGYFLPSLRKKYHIHSQNSDTYFFSFRKEANPPLIELVAAGSAFDRDFVIAKFPEIQNNPALIPHIFYLLLQTGGLTAVNMHDGILHYSADRLKPYLRKIRWRILNNIYHKEDMGESGFSGRQKFSGKSVQLRKMLFVPYSFLLIPALLDSVFMAFSRKNWKYLIHGPLSFYTGTMILFHMCLKTLGRRPALRSYDGSIKVNIQPEGRHSE